MSMALEDAVGQQHRVIDYDDLRARDRRATVSYGARQEIRGGLSGAESYAIRNNLYIGESLVDTALGNEPPNVRAGIQRLAMLAFSRLPEPVLIENSTKGSHSVLTLAVLAEYIVGRGDGTMLVGPFRSWSGPTPVTSRIRTRWVQEAGMGYGYVLECVEELGEDADLMAVQALQTDGLEGVTRLGAGPLRNYELAGVVARERLGAGWTQKRIADYLSVFGFINSVGTIGRWNHLELTRLLRQS